MLNERGSLDIIIKNWGSGGVSLSDTMQVKDWSPCGGLLNSDGPQPWNDGEELDRGPVWPLGSTRASPAASQPLRLRLKAHTGTDLFRGILGPCPVRAVSPRPSVCSSRPWRQGLRQGQLCPQQPQWGRAAGPLQHEQQPSARQSSGGGGRASGSGDHSGQTDSQETHVSNRILAAALHKWLLGKRKGRSRLQGRVCLQSHLSGSCLCLAGGRRLALALILFILPLGLVSGSQTWHLNMLIPRLHLRLTEPVFLVIGPRNPHFNELLRWEQYSQLLDLGPLLQAS